MLIRLIALFSLAVPVFCADWSARAAEQYMDSRQKEWVNWPGAVRSGVACVSCHTGLPYLVARPALRQALNEKTGPTLYEGLLVSGMRATVFRTDANDLFGGLKGLIADQVYGAQAVLASLVLAMSDAPRGRMSAEGEKAFDRLWSLQLKEGPDKGAWAWSDFDLDPWETKDALYYGAALAALATGVAPEGYQARPDIQANVGYLRQYLIARSPGQPLHNRLFLLWASSKLSDLLPDSDKQAIVDQVWRTQQTDGGWTLESLGPWKKRDKAPQASGSNSYATALVALAVEKSGTPPSHPGLARALNWLRSHQDSRGSWLADSMNHKHDAGTMPEKFMSDAATGYATAALLGAGDVGDRQASIPGSR